MTLMCFFLSDGFIIIYFTFTSVYLVLLFTFLLLIFMHMYGNIAVSLVIILSIPFFSLLSIIFIYMWFSGRLQNCILFLAIFPERF